MKKISDKDLKKLAELALQTEVIGRKYGISGFTQTFLSAYKQIIGLKR